MVVFDTHFRIQGPDGFPLGPFACPEVDTLSKQAGRSGGRWRKLKDAQRAKKLPCYLCGNPINYAARDPNADDAFSVDHIQSWIAHPELREDPANLASAHQLCNKQKSNRPVDDGLGLRSREW